MHMKKNSYFFPREIEMSSTTISSQPFFSPLQISGCGLWLDASDPTTLRFANGSNVATWTDKSANIQAQYLTQAMATARAGTSNSAMTGLTGSPNYPTSGSNINGLNSLYFNQSVLQAITTQNVNTRSYFIVLSVPTSAGGPSILWPGTWGSLGGGVYAVGGSIGGNSTQMIIASQNVANLLFLNYTQNSPFILSITFSNGTTNMWNTGGGTTSPTGQSAATLSQTADNYLWIGGASGAFGSPFLLGEFLEYNSALNTTQRQQIEGYLAWKWGLQASLPATHPYKTTSLIGNNVLPPLVRSLANTTTMAPSQSAFTFFRPTQVSGCQLWLDAADSASITQSGGTITNVLNKGNPSIVLSNASGFTYNSASKAFSNSVASSSANLGRNASHTQNQPGTLFAVASFTSATSNPYIIDSRSSEVLVGRFAYSIVRNVANTADVAYAFAGNGNPPDYGLRTAANIPSNTTIIHTLLMNDASSDVRLNGVTQTFIQAPGTNSMTGITVANRYTDNQSWVGSINEILLYNRGLSLTERQQVEGYLAWKWGLQGNLPATHPFKNAPPGLPVPSIPVARQMASGSFGPLKIAGCQLWLDATDPNANGTLPANASSVGTWYDKSGNANNAVTFNNLFPTFFRRSSYTNLPFLQFNGTNWSNNNVTNVNVMSLPNFQNTARVSAFYVCLGNATYFPTNGMRPLFIYKGVFGGTQVFLETNPANVGIALGSPTLYRTIGISGVGNTVYLNSAVYNDSLKVFNGGQNGANTSFSVGSSGWNESMAGTVGSLSIGAYFDTFGKAFQNLAFNGEFYEVLVFNAALSTSQRQQIEGYLAWKWGLVSSLPANHPYKMFPPPPV